MKTITALLFFAVVSCSSERCIKNNPDFIDIKHFECWLNLMPGGKPSFHYTGDIIVGVDKIKIEFKEIEFIATEKSLHKSKPIIERINGTIVENNKTKLYRFYSPQNLLVTDEMLKTQFVDVKFIFVIDEKPIKIFKKEIQLQRAY